MNINNRILNAFLILVLLANSVPVQANPPTSSRTPYVVRCDDVLQVLEAGQLEELILSTDRSEDEIIQILKDNYVLSSPIFINAASLVLSPRLGRPQDLSSANPVTLYKIAKKALRIIKSDSISNSDIDKIFEQMEILASSSFDSDSSNRTMHLIVKRTLDAVRKNTINRNRIYEVYRKASSQLVTQIGISYASASQKHTKKNIYDGGNSLYLLLVGSLAIVMLSLIAGSFFGSEKAFFITGSSLFFPLLYFTVQNIFMAFNNPKTFFKQALNSSKNILGMDPKNIHPFASQKILKQLPSLSNLDSEWDLSQLTLTEASYAGHSEMIELNQRYSKINEILQSPEIKDQLQAVRATAQELLQTPQKYSTQMNFAQQVDISIEALTNFLNTQKAELQSAAKIIENLESTLNTLKNTPYARKGKISKEDILKGEIILKRFDSELKRLGEQAVHIATLRAQIDKTESLLATLTKLNDKIPNTALGWEEAAKSILQEIDNIFVEFQL